MSVIGHTAFPGEVFAYRWGNERCLVGVDKGSVPNKVNFMSTLELGLLEKLPERERDRKQEE